MLYGGAAAAVRPTLDEHVEQGIALTSFKDASVVLAFLLAPSKPAVRTEFYHQYARWGSIDDHSYPMPQNRSRML